MTYDAVDDVRLHALLRSADEAARDGGGGRLLCAACGTLVTSTGARTEAGGSHAHRFVNPAGLRFEIGCFGTAPGAVPVGQATREWTWFNGYAWRVALCAGCSVQLGWHYAGGRGHAFFGLILDALREQGAGDAG